MIRFQAEQVFPDGIAASVSPWTGDVDLLDVGLGSSARCRRRTARSRALGRAGGWSADGAVKDDDSRGFMLTELRYRRPLP
jgi:hypothetical protein